jgi:hypothetical protein
MKCPHYQATMPDVAVAFIDACQLMNLFFVPHRLARMWNISSAASRPSVRAR